jgi:hypothetical protein
MARFNDYYSSRGRGRGKPRGCGFNGCGRGWAPVNREQRAPQQEYTNERNIVGRGIRTDKMEGTAEEEEAQIQGGVQEEGEMDLEEE